MQRINVRKHRKQEKEKRNLRNEDENTRKRGSWPIDDILTICAVSVLLKRLFDDILTILLAVCAFSSLLKRRRHRGKDREPATSPFRAPSSRLRLP